MTGYEVPNEGARRNLSDVLTRLEEVLLDLDELELHVPGAHVSQAIEHIRSLLKS
jgi:hypothetical protein